MSDQVFSASPQGTSSVVGDAYFQYLLGHADDNMVLAQRLGEWISRAPELEIDIALANIALDHLGVARNLYERAGQIEGIGRGEDELAMLRSEREYLNVLLVEQPNGDFATTVTRQLFFDVSQRLLWTGLATSDDEFVRGVAGRAGKEAAYHFEFSSSWAIRLGDGTEESHRRMQDAVDSLWRFTGEVAGSNGEEWHRDVAAVLGEATIEVPEDPYQRAGGREGYHTEHLGPLLAEMQWMQRSYPGSEW